MAQSTRSRQRALKRAKSLERRIAKAFGSKRVYASGGLHAVDASATGADIHHETLFIEAKSSVQWRHHRVLREVEKQAKKEGKLPLLVTAIPGEPGMVASLPLDLFISILDGGLEAWKTTTTKNETPSETH